MNRFMFLVVAILLMFFMACNGKSDSPEPEQPIVTGTDTPPPEIPIPPQNQTPIKLALQTADGLKFFDGEKLLIWKTGNTRRADSAIYSCENSLYQMDANGNIIDNILLPIIPELVATEIPAINPGLKSLKFDLKSTEITLDDLNVWTIKTIPAEEAYAQGALYKDYTQIFLNIGEYGTSTPPWIYRDYTMSNITVKQNDIFGQKTNGQWIHINGDKTNIRVVLSDGFIVWNFNTEFRTAMIDNISVSWTKNFFFSSDHWLKSGTTWYSQNGYSWDGTTLIEDGLTMADWRYRQNTVIPAGVRYENGVDVMYWIEARTGYVVRHVPSANQYIQYVQLYPGDGTIEIGVWNAAHLKPLIFEDGLYFLFGNPSHAFKYDFKTGLVNLFAGNVSEIWKY